MLDPQTVADRYIALWNETDAKRRRALLAKYCTETAAYSDPMMRGRGADEIDALIAGVHERFPGFRFAISGLADGHGDHARFSWQLGPEGAEAIVKGTDVVRIDGDRIAEVIGFLDQVPAI
jgi:hypothetical protein